MTTIAACAMCKHCKIKNDKLVCSAFPNGIPKNFVDSTNPTELKQCNNGIGFEPINKND